MMHLTFEQFANATYALAKLIKDSNFQPEMIIAVARGGWIPARLLSSCLGVKRLASIGLTYKDSARTQLETYSLPSPLPAAGLNVLLVEDCLESGKSLDFAKTLLMKQGINVRTAAVFILPAAIPPDYAVQTINTVPRFPWE